MVIVDVAEQGFAKLEREWDSSLLATFAVESDQHVIEVNVPNVQSKGFGDPASGI